MSSVRAKAPEQETRGATPQLVRAFQKKQHAANTKPLQKAQRTFQEIISDKETKSVLNYLINGSAIAASFLTFANANLRGSDKLQESLNVLSEVLVRVGTVFSGLIGASDTYSKRNPIAFLGYAAMIGVGTFVRGIKQWLGRGISTALINAVYLIDRREVVDKNGNAEKDANGKIRYLSADFNTGKNEGWQDWVTGFKVTARESGKMLKELVQNPKRIIKFSHATLVTSIIQFIGPLIVPFGFIKTGSAIRNFGGITNYFAMLPDKKVNGNKKCPTNGNGEAKGINLRSEIVQCSIARIFTSVIDFAKLFQPFENRFSNLTDLSLSLDRFAAIRYYTGMANMSNGNGKH